MDSDDLKLGLKYGQENQGVPQWAKIHRFDYKYKGCKGCGWAVKSDLDVCPNCRSKEFRELTFQEKDRLNRQLSARVAFFD